MNLVFHVLVERILKELSVMNEQKAFMETLVILVREIQLTV